MSSKTRFVWQLGTWNIRLYVDDGCSKTDETVVVHVICNTTVESIAYQDHGDDGIYDEEEDVLYVVWEGSLFPSVTLGPNASYYGWEEDFTYNWTLLDFAPRPNPNDTGYEGVVFDASVLSSYADANGVLDDTTTLNPTFTSNVLGMWVFELAVSDGCTVDRDVIVVQVVCSMPPDLEMASTVPDNMLHYPGGFDVAFPEVNITVDISEWAIDNWDIELEWLEIRHEPTDMPEDLAVQGLDIPIYGEERMYDPESLYENLTFTFVPETLGTWT